MALPPKGAWKYLLGVGFRSLTAYPAAWPMLSVLMLIKVALLLLGSEWFKFLPSARYEQVASGLLTAPVSLLLYTYCIYGLLFGFTQIKWRHFLLSMWRNLLAALLMMLCIIICMIPAVLVGIAVGFASTLLKHMDVSPALILVMQTLLFLGIFITMFYIMVRLAFVTVAAVAEGRISVSRPWRLSIGWGKTLLACWLILSLLSILVVGALMLAGYAASPKLFIVGTSIFSDISTMIYFAILVKAYKKAAQEEPAVSPTSESF